MHVVNFVLFCCSVISIHDQVSRELTTLLAVQGVVHSSCGGGHCRIWCPVWCIEKTTNGKNTCSMGKCSIGKLWENCVQCLASLMFNGKIMMNHPILRTYCQTNPFKVDKSSSFSCSTYSQISTNSIHVR